MTETPKSATRLLTEAARIAGFRAADGWPDELNPRQLAALLAGGRKEPHKQAYSDWEQMIANGIKSGTLATRIETRPPVEVCRDADDLSDYDRFRKATFPALDRMTGRARLVYYEMREQSPLHHVPRNPCAAWLRAIGEEPSEHVRAWLGTAWKDEERGASKVDVKKESIRSILRRIKVIDPNFSPDAMPGIRGDFFALCKKLDRAHFAHINQATFNDYLPGICQFRKGSRHSDYYENVAPQMGVKSVKPV